MSLHNHWVKFRIEDVYLPEPSDLLFKLHRSDELQGRIADICNDGNERGAFAVVAVEGIDRPLVVPIKRVVVVSGPASGPPPF